MLKGDGFLPELKQQLLFYHPSRWCSIITLCSEKDGHLDKGPGRFICKLVISGALFPFRNLV
jgi:hypothetical protein